MNNNENRRSILDRDEHLENINENYIGNRKVKKFFKIATPILIIEFLAIIALGTYLILLPKNFCNISVNNKDAVIYVNDKETKRFRFTNPKEEQTFYYYDVDVSILLPAGKTYSVSYTVDSKDYTVYVATSATQQNKIYYVEVVGGEKTQLLSGLTFKSDTLIKDFDVNIDITVKT